MYPDRNRPTHGQTGNGGVLEGNGFGLVPPPQIEPSGTHDQEHYDLPILATEQERLDRGEILERSPEIEK